MGWNQTSQFPATQFPVTCSPSTASAPEKPSVAEALSSSHGIRAQSVFFFFFV